MEHREPEPLCGTGILLRVEIICGTLGNLNLCGTLGKSETLMWNFGEPLYYGALGILNF